MRIATYNVEWFGALFDDQDQLIMNDRWSGRHNVTCAQQAQALGTVFKAIDADAVMVIEAPDQNGQRDTVMALEAFARAYDLRACKAVLGFSNDTQQEIALLYDPNKIKAVHDPIGVATGKKRTDGVPRFDEVFHIDLDVDATEDVVRFSKPPLELQVNTAMGNQFRMIGAHLKSKAPHGARSRDEVIRLSVANRRKQLAQAIWLRARIATHLEAGDSLILLGDLNDGPGLDEYENLFGRSSVEIVMGEDGANGLFDPNARAILRRRLAPIPTSSRFFLAREGRYLQALLDYVMISSDMCDKKPCWRIWHPFDDYECWRKTELREALLTASDHFPVVLDIEI